MLYWKRRKMKKSKVYLPNDADPGNPSPLYYTHLDDVGKRLIAIFTDEIKLSASQKMVVLGALNRNRADHWEMNYDLTITLEYGGEEASVKFRLDKDDIPWTTIDNQHLYIYKATVTCSWSTTTFDLAHAIVHLKLHQRAITLMAQLEHEFGGLIGREI